MLTCRRGPYNELDEQCEGEDGFDEAPHVLEGSGLTTAPVDGMGGRTRGMRTRGRIKIHETSMKVRPPFHLPYYGCQFRFISIGNSSKIAVICVELKEDGEDLEIKN
jgi:hypothetical protein